MVDKAGETTRSYPDVVERVAKIRNPASVRVGNLVRTMRKQAGLTQLLLCGRTGLTQSRLSDIERGEGRLGPTWETVDKIARACQCRVVFELVAEKPKRRASRANESD